MGKQPGKAAFEQKMNEWSSRPVTQEEITHQNMSETFDRVRPTVNHPNRNLM
jgi:hypothetical protein